MSIPGNASTSRNCLMLRSSTQLLPNPPKKKLAQGAVGSFGENPAELRSQIDECRKGRATPRSRSPQARK
jgi:hypothetical protein